MWDLTRNNHMIYGYNGLCFNKRTAFSDLFWSSYGKCVRPVDTFLEEGIVAANEINDYARTIGKEPILFYSGGQDSEVMIEIFLQTNDKVTIFNLNYEVDGIVLNSYDQDLTRRYIDRRKDRLNIITSTINLIDVCSTDRCFKLALDSNCKFIYMMPISLAMIELSKDGYLPLLGNSESFFIKESSWNFVELEYMMAWHNSVIHEQIAAIPGFFQWSPEFMLSFLKEPEIMNCATGNLVGKLNSRSSKYDLYRRIFNLENRIKSDGFEDIRNNKIICDINRRLGKSVHYGLSSAQRYSYNELVGILNE